MGRGELLASLEMALWTAADAMDDDDDDRSAGGGGDALRRASCCGSLRARSQPLHPNPENDTDACEERQRTQENGGERHGNVLLTAARRGERFRWLL